MSVGALISADFRSCVQPNSLGRQRVLVRVVSSFFVSSFSGIPLRPAMTDHSIG